MVINIPLGQPPVIFPLTRMTVRDTLQRRRPRFRLASSRHQSTGHTSTPLPDALRPV